MPRFFLNLHECGSVVNDEEGTEMPDLDAARLAATAAARDIMAGELKQGRLCLSCHIDIFDESGASLARIPFHEAVVISGPY